MNKTDLVAAVANKGSIAELLDQHELDLIADPGVKDHGGRVLGTPMDDAGVERLSRDMIDTVLADVLDVIGLSLTAGEPVNIRGFGRFDPRDRKPVTRLNPATQEPIHVPAKRSVGFVPSQKLKERLNGGPSSS